MLLIVIGALIIGLTLGMLGSGGSAITVPLLIYLVGHGTKQSIAESMAIVGLISVVAAIPYAHAKQIDWRSVWCFGLPGMVGTFAGAWLGGHSYEALQLTVFAVVLIGAAYSMLTRPCTSLQDQDQDPTTGQWRPSRWLIAVEGCVVGILTGFVGVGGGFLIVPALMLLGRLPIRMAIGTSLVIIILNAAVGFAKYEQYLLLHRSSVDVSTIALFVVVGTIGSVIGRTLNKQLNQRVLQHAFACLLIVLGGFVMLREGNKLFVGASSPKSAITFQTKTPVPTVPRHP